MSIITLLLMYSKSWRFNISNVMCLCCFSEAGNLRFEFFRKPSSFCCEVKKQNIFYISRKSKIILKWKVLQTFAQTPTGRYITHLHAAEYHCAPTCVAYTYLCVWAYGQRLSSVSVSSTILPLLSNSCKHYFTTHSSFNCTLVNGFLCYST